MSIAHTASGLFFRKQTFGSILHGVALTSVNNLFDFHNVIVQHLRFSFKNFDFNYKIITFVPFFQQ